MTNRLTVTKKTRTGERLLEFVIKGAILHYRNEIHRSVNLVTAKQDARLRDVAAGVKVNLVVTTVDAVRIVRIKRCLQRR